VVCAHRDASAHVGDPGTLPWRALNRIKWMSDESSSVRCWICLEDSPTCDGMISPCSCVGTNKWVHESCLKSYCLQFLATNAANASTLNVACPICRTPYQITTRGSVVTGWRELLRWSATDRQLLLRHARFFFLAAPLIVSSALTWTWLVAYWEDLYHSGPGEPLMEGSVPLASPHRLTSTWHLHRAISWVRVGLPDALGTLLDTSGLSALFPLGPVGGSQPTATDDRSGSPTGPPAVHPAGISQNWSVLYVWLQYMQWYKVLSWLVILVLGTFELLPHCIREAFRVEELLLASDTRAQVFILGQCIPFLLTKARHFLVTWAGSSYVVRLLFYSAFTSHVEVGSTLACDMVVTAHLLYDWLSSVSNDFSLRLNLNRLRSGYFAIASLPADSAQRQRHAHQE